MRRVQLGTGPWRGAEPERDIVQWGSISVAFQLDQPNNGTIRVMSAAHPTTPGVRLAENDLWAYDDNGTLFFRARMLPQPLDVTPDSAKIDFNLVDYRGLLDRRFLMSDVNHANVEQAEIAWSLIAHTQAQSGGDLGITRGSMAATGQLRDRNYEAGDNVGQRLQELSNVSNGFQYEIDAERRFNLWSVTRRQTAPYVLHLPGTVDYANIESGIDRYYKAVVVTGDKSVIGPAVRASADVALAPEGRWEASFAYPDVTNPTTLASHADGRLADGQELQRLFNLQVAPQLAYDADFFPLVGDVTPIFIRWPTGEIETTAHVVSVEWFIEPHGGVRCTLSCAEGA